MIGPQLSVGFEASSISLELSSEGVTLGEGLMETSFNVQSRGEMALCFFFSQNMWLPMFSLLQVTKKIVDSFGLSGQEILSFQIRAE